MEKGGSREEERKAWPRRWSIDEVPEKEGRGERLALAKRRNSF